jgi:hypothetical protein
MESSPTLESTEYATTLSSKLLKQLPLMKQWRLRSLMIGKVERDPRLNMFYFKRRCGLAGKCNSIKEEIEKWLFP